MPITLKFTDAVGEILTAGPIRDVPPLPFGLIGGYRTNSVIVGAVFELLSRSR